MIVVCTIGIIIIVVVVVCTIGIIITIFMLSLWF